MIKNGKPDLIKNTHKKKIIENRGGNLTPINEIFGAKRKKLNDSNVVDKATKDTEDKMLSQNMLLTNNFYWRLSRSMDAGGDDRVDLDKLLDPASECEKHSWSRYAFKLNEINEHPHKPQTDDFEDIYFYYKTYETDSVLFLRTSIKQELLKAYESKKTHLREKQLKYHPDNNIDKEDTVRGMFEDKNS